MLDDNQIIIILFNAIDHNYLPIVKHIISLDTKILLKKNMYNETLLYYCCKKKDIDYDIIKFIIEHDNKHFVYDGYYSCIHLVVENGRIDLFQLLSSYTNPLILENEEIFNEEYQLIQNNKILRNTRVQHIYKMPILFNAVKSNNIEMVKQILNLNININNFILSKIYEDNIMLEKYYDALIYAIINQNEEIINILIEHNILIKKNHLLQAIEINNVNIVKIIMKYITYFNDFDYYFENIEIYHILSKHYKNVLYTSTHENVYLNELNIKKEDLYVGKMTPLFIAIKMNNEKIIKFIMENEIFEYKINFEEINELLNNIKNIDIIKYSLNKYIKYNNILYFDEKYPQFKINRNSKYNKNLLDVLCEYKLLDDSHIYDAIKFNNIKLLNNLLKYNIEYSLDNVFNNIFSNDDMNVEILDKFNYNNNNFFIITDKYLFNTNNLTEKKLFIFSKIFENYNVTLNKFDLETFIIKLKNEQKTLKLLSQIYKKLDDYNLSIKDDNIYETFIINYENILKKIKQVDNH